ncbi:hypothetical protein KAU43_06260 [candidate division WOR-3 bacterium]|nr:hypothetical protein [candidate division WOR-3 bacterium]
MKFSIVECGNCKKKRLLYGNTMGYQCSCGHWTYVDNKYNRIHVQEDIEKRLTPFSNTVEELEKRKKYMLEKYHFVVSETYTKTDDEMMDFLTKGTNLEIIDSETEPCPLCNQESAPAILVRIAHPKIIMFECPKDSGGCGHTWGKKIPDNNNSNENEELKDG